MDAVVKQSSDFTSSASLPSLFSRLLSFGEFAGRDLLVSDENLSKKSLAREFVVALSFAEAGLMTGTGVFESGVNFVWDEDSSTDFEEEAFRLVLLGGEELFAIKLLEPIRHII